MAAEPPAAAYAGVRCLKSERNFSTQCTPTEKSPRHQEAPAPQRLVPSRQTVALRRRDSRTCGPRSSINMRNWTNVRRRNLTTQAKPRRQSGDIERPEEPRLTLQRRSNAQLQGGASSGSRRTPSCNATCSHRSTAGAGGTTGGAVARMNCSMAAATAAASSGEAPGAMTDSFGRRFMIDRRLSCRRCRRSPCSITMRCWRP